MMNISFDFSLFNNEYYFYERLLVLVIALASTVVFSAYVLYTDRKNKEPLRGIIVCLLSGLLTIALSAYFEEVALYYIANEAILIYIWAAIEEFAKMAIFLLFIYDNIHYDDIYDSVVYMALIALSFAGFENIMYAFSESTVTDSIGLALMRDFTTIPLHVICGIIIGYFLSLSNFSKKKSRKIINIIFAIVIPTIVHGTFNFTMTLLGNLDIDASSFLQLFLSQTLPILVFMIILFYLAIKFSRKTVVLNDAFINGYEYDKKYSYLMTKEEYYKSSGRLKRIKMHDKIKFYKFKEREVN